MASDPQGILQSRELQRAAAEISAAAAFLAGQGLTPATSSNFSARLRGEDGLVAISRSGVDKHAFRPDDVMVVDASGRVVAPASARPSAETALHLALYAARKDVLAVLHTHSVAATVLSLRHADEGVTLEGLEILKAFQGVTTHEARLRLAVLPNSQDMPWLAGELRSRVEKGLDVPGVLIAGHGLYAWGGSVLEARRHVEAFEFALACVLELERG